MDGVRDDAAPYGVDTIRLRISLPAAPVSQGYNGRMWRMRPLRGWTGRQAGGERGAVRRGRAGKGLCCRGCCHPHCQSCLGGEQRRRGAECR